MNSYWYKKYKSRNRYSPQMNRIMGRLCYFFIHLLVFAFSYKIWGLNMLDELWFYFMHFFAFFSVKFVLRDILHFWSY